jgi:hypothetical protein
MRSFRYLLFAFLFVSCSPQAPIPQNTLPPTSTPVPTSTVAETQQVEQSPTPIPTSIVVSTEPPSMDNSPDFSAVLLFEATHLMDPSFFQIVLQNWPMGVPETVQVFVDNDEFNCEVLFPDQFPDRNYCWGAAPKRGSQVNVVVLLKGETAPVLEIPFVVPSPGSGGEG